MSPHAQSQPLRTTHLPQEARAAREEDALAVVRLLHAQSVSVELVSLAVLTEQYRPHFNRASPCSAQFRAKSGRAHLL